MRTRKEKEDDLERPKALVSHQADNRIDDDRRGATHQDGPGISNLSQLRGMSLQFKTSIPLPAEWRHEGGQPDSLRSEFAESERGEYFNSSFHARRPNLSRTGIAIQRAPAEGGTTTTTTPPAETTQPPASTTTAPPEEVKTPTPGLIVDDSAVELLPGQMKKSAFLAQLRTAVCDTAEIALSGTIWSVMGCPWIDYWFGYYSGRDSQSIERAIQRYTGAGGVTSAADYIPIICARVRFAIEAWRTTGEAKGVPEGVPGGMPGTASPAAEGGPTATPGPISFKPREGNTGKTTDPAAVQARLDTGSPLDSGIRSQMETAFGQDFSGVRVHTDTKAGTLSEDLNARAFTVGRDIAFASGEYQPGTLIGDALIAHELAHVVQQGGGTATAPMQKGETESGSLEEEADISVIGVLRQIFHDVVGTPVGWRRILPRMRASINISRCSKSQKPSPEGIHYDEAISCLGTPKKGLQKTFPNISVDESAEQEEVLSNLATMNAGGVYIFFGHGAIESSSGTAAGINPASGHTIRGEEIEKQLKSDKNPPTVVVLGACGSQSLLTNVISGGVPVAVGFNQSVSNAAAATAVNVFMTELNAGKTFGEAREKANELLAKSPFDVMPEIIVIYGAGYHAGMTLQEARDRHTGK
jgi:hypothetical protein